MSNEARFEVFPETREAQLPPQVPARRELTGQFVWHFQDANGRITFTGGESFTRREDAHRSIEGVCCDILAVLFGFLSPELVESIVAEAPHLPIVDLDENGKVIA